MVPAGGGVPRIEEEKFRFGMGGGDLPPTVGSAGKLDTEVGVLGVTLMGEPPGGDFNETGVVGPEDPT